MAAQQRGFIDILPAPREYCLKYVGEFMVCAPDSQIEQVLALLDNEYLTCLPSDFNWDLDPLLTSISNYTTCSDPPSQYNNSRKTICQQFPKRIDEILSNIV